MKLIQVAWQDGNFSPRIAEILKHLPTGEEILIRFEKGIYHFFAQDAFTSDRPIAAMHDGKKTFVFLLENVKNLTIDGGGSEFIFHDRLSPFAFFDCQNIKVCNLVIDFSFSRYCQGDVVASDENAFELKINSELFHTEVDSAGHAVFFSNSSRFPTDGTPILLGNQIFGKAPWDYIFAGDTPVSKENLPTGYIETDAEKTAGGLRFRYRPQSRRLLLELGETLIFCYEPRNNVNILFQSCRNVQLEEVSMYRGGGMGVIVSTTENFSADRVAVQVRPGRPECRSTTADAFYFTQCSGKCIIRNSIISDTLDDALNLHGLYAVVSEKISESSVKVHLPFSAGVMGYKGICTFRTNDQLVISDRETHCGKYSGKILHCEKTEEGYFLLQMDRPLGLVEAGDQVENDSYVAEFHFLNNRVSRCPHVRVSDNGGIEIRGNRFEQLGSLLVDDLYAFWLETGAVDGLTIEDNTFVHCPRYGEEHAIAVETTRHNTSDVRHKNVVIRNNRFQNCSGTVIEVRAVDGVRISGNTLSDGTVTDWIHVADCTGVEQKDNTLSESRER